MDRPDPGARRVLGTAGHIDHGKTALVRALTGVDTDRLPEEKARGITIALGFAPLDLGGGLRMSVVDVPGHERLVRTMVAGASGIDVLLLVVAADEGVMPQTREHLAVCDLLGLRRAVVALSKCDLVDDETATLAEEEVHGLLAPGPLADAPVVRVSAVTGAGLSALRDALRACALEGEARTPRWGPPRLWIDRVFAMRGFGTVVTGTLVGAALETGQRMGIEPSGLVARVRGLQTHGQAAERVEPGVRCAVNLQGVDVAAVARGQVVTLPGRVAPTDRLDARVRWLPGTPPLTKPSPALFLAGTAECLARVTLVGDGPVAPGRHGLVRVHLERGPLPLLPGDGFVLRGFARTGDGGWTLGGGTVLDVAPVRLRAGDPELLHQLELLAAGDADTGLVLRAERAGAAGVTTGELSARTGLGPDDVAARMDARVAAGEVIAAGGGRWLAAAAAEALGRDALAALAAYHQHEPLQPGMPRGALRGRLPERATDDVVDTVLARLAAAGAIVLEGDRVRRREHAPSLGASDRDRVERIRAESHRRGLAPPTAREWGERLGVAPSRVRDLLAHLEREGVLVRAPGDLWFDRAAVDALRERVVDHLRAHRTLDTKSYKRLIGTTRKHAVPLMELLDAEGLTRRRGEVRVLLGTAASPLS